MAEKPPAKGKNAADDRNLIDAEASESGLDFETWVINFWQTNRKTILSAIILALVIVVSLQLYRIISAHQESSTREAYAEATTDEAKQAFAESHQGHPLAGAALLSLADSAYGRGDYNEAAGLYEEAAGDLELPVLVFRASLGQGVSLIQFGLQSKGEPILLGLADNTAAPEAIRSEAWYHLASLAIVAGEIEKARGYLDSIEELSPVGIWASRATALRNTLPAPVAE